MIFLEKVHCDGSDRPTRFDPVLLVQLREADCEAFSKDRLAPMLRDCGTLRGKVADARSRDSNNTILHKKFTGGSITMSAASSPAGLAMRSIRYCRQQPYFEQLLGEALVTTYSKGQPVREWRPMKGVRHEALDARVYAFGALRALISMGMVLDAEVDRIAAQAGSVRDLEPVPRVIRSRWISEL